MAITNAQQYQQLVNKPANGKRPGYRGDAAYGRSSRSTQATSIGQAKGATGLGGGASLGDRRDKDEKSVERPSEINPLNEIKRELTLENFRNRRPEVNIPPYMIGAKMFQPFIQKFSDISAKENRGFFANPNYRFNLFGIDLGPKKSVIEAGRYQLPGELGVKYGKLGYEDIGQMTEEELDQAYKEYLNAKLSGEIDAYGNPLMRGDGDQPIIPLTPYQENVVKDEVDPNSLAGLLANRQAYRFMANGGRAGFAGGGMPYEGGIMDLESARQMYGLGKLVKKATGAIKKIVKSPVGKAALLYFGGNALMNKSGGLGIKDFLTRSFLGKEVSGGDPSGRGRTGGILQFMKDNPLLTIAGGSTLAGLFAGQDEEDEVQPYYRGPGLDIDAIRRDPYGTKGPAFGFYAKGGDVKEPVAKDTMPLLDMNGMEKDYRADGGFVPIGRMERADDVPARLSKNEFVFTADAVRNAGDGDIDKGAEVMYNVMKNLEAGGNISEESQGLNGARDMFQTSKRLEEVL